MATFTGTIGKDTITPTTVSAGVLRDPAGTFPSAAADAIEGMGGPDVLDGGGGSDTITFFGNGVTARGGSDNDTLAFYTQPTEAKEVAVAAAVYGDGENDVISYYAQQGADDPRGTLRLDGGIGNDVITSWGWETTNFNGLNINAYGGAGNDRLEALAFNTSSMGDPVEPGGNDKLYGGPGDDTYWVLSPSDAAIENANEGNDTVVVYETDYTLGANVENLVVDSRSYSGYTSTGNALANSMTGGDTRDTIVGAAGGDTLDGGDNNDLLQGDAGNDTFVGEDGNDKFFGGDGNDWFMGGAGQDKIYGQAGTDVFYYDSVSESKPGATLRDIIYDFAGIGGSTRTEAIDLSTIDANSGLAGNQAFTFKGTGAFTDAGQLRLASSGVNTVIQASTDADTAAEFEIQVNDGAVLPAQWAGSDFIL